MPEIKDADGTTIKVGDRGGQHPGQQHPGERMSPCGTWTIEFPASTIGEANDLLRQAARHGSEPLTATPAGRLGFEARGPKSLIDEAAQFLRGRQLAVYVTR